MNTNPEVETSNDSGSSPAPTRVLEQSEQAKHLVEESAKELNSVNSGIKKELKGLSSPSVVNPLDKNKAVEGKVQEASEKLAVVNVALEAQIRDRIQVDLRLATAVEQSAASRHAALHDALTDLPNQAMFDDRLEHGTAQGGCLKSLPKRNSLYCVSFQERTSMNVHIASNTPTRHVVRNSRISRNHHGVLASLGWVVLVSLAQSDGASAATAPNLGTTSTYGVVSMTYTNANTSPQTIINGDVCYTTGPTTPPLTITGATRTPCPPQTGLDQGAATANANGQVCTFLGAGAITLDAVVIGGNPPGTIPPGCYSSGGAMLITATTNVTLNGAGVYIFRPGGALNTGDNSNVLLTNGACASDVFWVPVGATTLGANAALSPTPTFSGNILDAAGITIGHFANMTGRALAFGGTVTTDADTITVPTCAPFGSGNAALTPTLSDWALITLGALLAMAGFAAIRRTRT